MNLSLRVRAAWSMLTGASPLAFDAAGRGTRLINWNPPVASFGSLRQPVNVLARARDSYRNNPWARRAIEATIAGAIGVGIKPQLQTSNPARNRAAHEAFLQWTDWCDFQGRRDFFGFQCDVLRSLLVDGETLVVMSPFGRGRVPLELKLLAPEYLDPTRDVPGQIDSGIEYDAEGRRVAYWIYPKHPADVPNMLSTRVPADQVLHVYWPLAAGVPRGVSWLQPALTALYEIQSFLESELVRARVASLFAGYVRSADGSNPLLNPQGELVLEPGSVSRLKPGEEVVFSTPPESRGFEVFIRTQLRAVASVLSMPYELLANDVSQVTFASGRHALLAWRRWLEMLQHHVLVFQLCRPVWGLWLRFAIMTGALPGSPEDYQPLRWIAPPIEMLDTRAEVTAVVHKIRAGVLSRSEAVSQTGLNAEQLEREIAAENARADALGLIFDSDPRRTSAQGQQQPSEGVTDAATN
jgi:lambda family phage portal protein